MGIDWYWIKQRPQILAEYLAKDYEVTVVYLKEVFCKQELRKDKDELEKSYAIPAIPYRDKNILVHVVQKSFFYKIMKKADEYDIIWVGQPLLYNYIPSTYRGKIIYDCMDNHEALCSDSKIKKVIHKTEIELGKRADTIFASSMGLCSKMQVVGGMEKVILIRNGFVFDKIYPPLQVSSNDNIGLKIGYFGTIAEWFDFSLLMRSLERFPDLEYYLWGPISGIELPKHPRLKIKGVIEHNKLWENVKNMDALIMPFKVNDVIKDVDPVKLYEYISMGKKIISIYYKELSHFSKFVNFYNDEAEYWKCIEACYKRKKHVEYIEKEQLDFLEENSWDVRYKKIKQYIR